MSNSLTKCVVMCKFLHVYAAKSENTITSVTNNIGDYDTPIDGMFDYEDIDEKELEPDSKPKAALKAAGAAAVPPPPHTKGNFYSKSPGPPTVHVPAVDDSENYESPVPTLPRVRE